MPDAFVANVAVDSQGRYWTFRNGEMPALFDTSGKYLGAVGRRGPGPAEFSLPYALLVVGRESLFVLDAMARRATLLDSNLTMVRTIGVPMPVSSAIVVSWPDSVIASGRAPLSEAPEPLHRLSLRGDQVEARSSFRMEQSEMPPEMMLLPGHRLSRPRNGRFWSAWNRRYDLRQWSADGTRSRSLERRPAWFPGVSPMNYDWRNEPPPSSVAAVDEDDSGLLWVFVLVARSTWKEAWADAPPGANEAKASMELLYATTVEAIDPVRARVVARTSIDGYAISALPAGRVAMYKVDETGVGRVEIMSVKIVRR